MGYTGCQIDAWTDEETYEIRCKYPGKMDDYLISKLPSHFEIFKAKVGDSLNQERGVVLSVREGGFFDFKKSPVLKKFREGAQALDYLSRSEFFKLSKSPTIRGFNSILGLLKRVFSQS